MGLLKLVRAIILVTKKSERGIIIVYYKKVIKSGSVLEVEIYKSIRKRNVKNICRSCNHTQSTEKQKALNEINAKKKCQRRINSNFTPNDLYITLNFSENQTETEANRLVNNFIRRLKYYCKKIGQEFKYIGCIECGKRGNRWHGHLVISKIPYDVITNLWPHGRVWFENLYQDGNYADLAKYISKDVTGKKRLKQSRNLVEPDVTVVEMNRKSIRNFENGVALQVPSGFTLVRDDINYNDITGISAYFMYSCFDETKRRCKNAN